MLGHILEPCSKKKVMNYCGIFSTERKLIYDVRAERPTKHYLQICPNTGCFAQAFSSRGMSYELGNYPGRANLKSDSSRQSDDRRRRLQDVVWKKTTVLKCK